MKLYYWNSRPNAGDYYTAWLFHKMHIPFALANKNAELIATGSILSHVHACNKNTKVWGSGYIKRDQALNPLIQEQNIYAVRGAYTYEKLGIKKKVALGDPGLLVSKYYHPNHTHKYKWGVVCHYVDEDYFRKALAKYNIAIISMATNDIEHVIDQICECDFIFSSSLHGIIFSHSLGIPAMHIEHEVLQNDTEHFKFRDYFSVLDIRYHSEQFTPELKFLKECLAHPENYVPTRCCVEQIQNNLINALPYKPVIPKKHMICAIAKCENEYVNDWVNWHLNLGFDEIHIYDNNDESYEPVENRIRINTGTVVIHKIPGARDFQRRVYNEFYQRYNDQFDWCAFIDLDEFIQLGNFKNIQDFTEDQRCSDVDVMRLKWLVYGDSNLIKRDMSIPVYKALTIPALTIYNTHAKCLLRGGVKNVEFTSVHYPKINGKTPKQKLPNGIVTYGEIKCNELSEGPYIKHFMTKTLDEFINQKLARGTDACFSDRVIDFDYFWRLNTKTKAKLDYLKAKGFNV